MNASVIFTIIFVFAQIILQSKGVISITEGLWYGGVYFFGFFVGGLSMVLSQKQQK